MPLSPTAGAFAHELSRCVRKKILIDELIQIYDTIDPISATSVHRPHLIAAIVLELAEAKIIRLPSTWSGSTPGHILPRFVMRIVASPVRESMKVLWRPELSEWAESACLSTPGLRSALVEINDWLRLNPHPDEAPLRERSWQIFRDEKKLDALLGTSLFGPQRLSLEILCTHRSRPPLPYESVGRGSQILVVENSDTYESVHRLLQYSPDSFGWVAWGGGNAFSASVATLTRIDGITAIYYFGDLDTEGLEIPIRASATALSLGLPPVMPWKAAYGLLLAYGEPTKAGRAVPESRISNLCNWLDIEHQEAVAAILMRGYRIAQEAIGYPRLLEIKSLL